MPAFRFRAEQIRYLPADYPNRCGGAVQCDEGIAAGAIPVLFHGLGALGAAG
jgi:hypothetical protein